MRFVQMRPVIGPEKSASDRASALGHAGCGQARYRRDRLGDCPRRAVEVLPHFVAEPASKSAGIGEERQREGEAAEV
jgi:hypothetical protein